MVNLNTVMLNELSNPVEFRERNLVLKDIKGVKKQVEEFTPKTLMLKKVLRQALLDDVGPKYRSARLHERRYDLYRKIVDVDKVTFTWREVSLLKKLVPLKFDVIISGQIVKLLKF